MKNFALFLGLCLLLVACDSAAETSTSTTSQSKAYVIVVDLSDRIHDSRIAEKDIKSILAIWDNFADEAKKLRYVGCEDAFCVLPLPQEGNEPIIALMDTLHIDLSTVPPVKRRQQIDNFSPILRDRLAKAYSAAKKEAISQYKGADPFSFFMDLPDGLISKHQAVKLVLFTDGYIEIEPEHRTSRQGKYTYMPLDKMRELRKNESWRSSSAAGFLMVPDGGAANFKSVSSMCVIGLEPKCNYVFEIPMLEAIWSGWLSNMGVPSVQFVKYYNNGFQIVKSEIENFLTKQS